MTTAYVLRVALRDLKPTVYREVLVDPSITLRKLHAVIQAAMGWENEHLHAFALPAGSERFWRVGRNRVFEPRNADAWGEPAQDDARTKVYDVLQVPKDKLLYMYDFGDDWEHIITLKAVVDFDQPLPHLLKAQYGCPPEDCGGPPGFEHWTAAWFEASDPGHAMALEIFGPEEPGTLHFEALQKAVRGLQRKAAPKKAV